MGRSASRTLGWLAALVGLGACSFDPTRPCDSDSDCVNGGSCDLATKTCVAAGDPNDRTPPTFSVVISPPPIREDTASVKFIDPGLADAYRRDDRVSVEVVSDDTDVLLSSVTLTVKGIQAGGDPGSGMAFGPCAAASPSAGHAFCVGVEISLGPAIPFDAFRGQMQFVAQGSDRSGNLSAPATASINVTRWRWRYTAGLPIRTTPAIADDGTVVFGTSNGTTGSLFALDPEANLKWPPNALGPIEASPAIGALSGGQQLLYIGTASRPSTLYAFSVADGSPAGSCLGSSNTKPGGEMWGSPAVFPSRGVGGPYESATAFASTQQLVTIRPSAFAPDRCVFRHLRSGSAGALAQTSLQTELRLFFRNE